MVVPTVFLKLRIVIVPIVIHIRLFTIITYFGCCKIQLINIYVKAAKVPSYVVHNNTLPNTHSTLV